MPRQELHSETLPPIEQMPPIDDISAYDGDIVLTQDVLRKDYADALAFMEEPVTIRLEPSADRNASPWMSVWVNGRGAEVLLNNRWVEFRHLPVGQVLTTKRKYVEVIIRAKIDTIHTEIRDMDGERPDNRISRFTSAAGSFSIIEDRNPLGAAWVGEMRRRYL